MMSGRMKEVADAAVEIVQTTLDRIEAMGAETGNILSLGETASSDEMLGIMRDLSYIVAGGNEGQRIATLTALIFQSWGRGAAFQQAKDAATIDKLIGDLRAALRIPHD